MNLGTLVAKKMRWTLNSAHVGIIIEKSEKDESWIVLWTQNGGYKIQEHLEDALIDLHEYTEREMKSRKCTSM